MCFIATVQSALVTLLLEPDPNTWKINSLLEVGSALYGVSVWMINFTMEKENLYNIAYAGSYGICSIILSPSMVHLNHRSSFQCNVQSSYGSVCHHIGSFSTTGGSIRWKVM